MAMTSDALLAPIGGRQGPVVTQTITRPFTTITAVVTLGDDPTTPSTSTSTRSTPSTTTPSGPISPAPPSAVTPEQLGAILGSILGFALVALLICCCLSARRRRRQQATGVSSYMGYYDGDSSVSEREVVVETTLRSTPDWNRPPLRAWPAPPPTTAAAGAAGGAAAAAAGAGSGGGGVWMTVPPPVRFPPTPRYTPYRQTRHPQMPGVVRRP